VIGWAVIPPDCPRPLIVLEDWVLAVMFALTWFDLTRQRCRVIAVPAAHLWDP